MTDTPPSDGPSQGAEFDMMGALDWKDGIATLPGSDIRFRMTEFGTLEIVTDLEVKGQEAEPNRETLDPAPTHTPTPPPEGQSQVGIAKLQPIRVSQGRLKVKLLVLCFCLWRRAPVWRLVPVLKLALMLKWAQMGSWQGAGPVVAVFPEMLFFRVNSVAPFVHSPPVAGEARESQGAEGERLGKRVRKKRKIYMDSGDEEEDNQEEPEEKAKTTKGRRGAKIAKLVAAPPNKKRAWSWPAYLEEEKAIAAPVKLFKEHQSFPQSRNSFKVGMKLEGLDPSHPSLFCVLTVAEIQGYRIRLHFDGYPECYDFWANADSWDIKPAGWCEKNGHKLLLPKGCKDGEFNWSMYVKNCRGQLAPKHLFKSLNTSVTPSGFRAGMKLEAVDRKNPSLICVATIAAVVDNRLLIHFDNWDDTYDYWCDASSPYIHPVGYCEEAELTLTTPAGKTQTKTHIGMKVEAVDKRNPMLIRVATISDTEDHRLKIHFDGWTSEYDYWVETDCPDLHPVGWCQKTGHPLQYPNGETHPSGLRFVKARVCVSLYSPVSCPYSEMNLNKEGLLPDRLSGERPLTVSGPHPRGRRPDPHTNTTTQSSSTPEHPEGAEDSQNRKPATVEAERLGRNNQAEPPSGASEQSHNGTRPKRTAPVPKYLKMHYVKEEIGDSKASPDAISLQQALHESVFSPGISASPPHRVALCWDKHCQLLPEVLGLTAKRVATWSAEEVASFVKGLPGCKEHAATFKTEQIDGEAFLLLTQADIVKSFRLSWDLP
ncbi:hypothetical protein INR49_024066 [Caranx melampygus]|nr:hypothetical protein INR49_024066 [Caranx melampygus]